VPDILTLRYSCL